MEKISEGISESTNSFAMYKMRALGLIQFWSSEIRQYGITLPDEMLEKIACSNTREDFENNCRKMINYSCQAVQESEHQLKIRRSVIQYLQSNFTDFNLSLNSMSDALGIRPAQINEILKKDIGMTFIQYVSALRLAKFKHLLLTSDKTIQSLVQEVGYVDVSAFIRKFRQTEGMTPGEYREKGGKSLTATK